MGTPSNVSTAAINTCVGRRQYLVTYSQADESKFSTREIFGKMLEAEFNAGTRAAKVDYGFVPDQLKLTDWYTGTSVKVTKR